MTDTSTHIGISTTAPSGSALLKLTDLGDGTYATASGAGPKVRSTFAFTRPANTTAYTAKDAAGPAQLVVSGATNATPIVLTTGTHGLADGDPVTVAAVGGNTNSNGDYFAKVTGYSATTFALYTDFTLATARAGNSAYTSGGTVDMPLRFTSVVRTAASSGQIIKATLLTSQTTNTETWRLHLYNAAPTALADNVACTAPLYADASKYIGTIEFPAAKTEASGTAAYSNSTGSVANSGLPHPFICAASNTSIYGILESVVGFTPATGQTTTIILTVQPD